MANDRCPWCGARQNQRDPQTWDCGTERLEVAVQTTQCVRHQLFDAQARVNRLEAALRGLLPHAKGTQYDTIRGDYAPYTDPNVAEAVRIAREALADTHGPGTMAGDAARNALRADA